MFFCIRAMKKIELIIQIYYKRFEKILNKFHIQLGLLVMLFYRLPFNGQQKRKELFSELLELSFSAIVETGMFIGSSTRYFSFSSEAEVYAVEKNSIYYWLASLRFKRMNNIHIFLSDSRRFLMQLRDNRFFPKKNVLFYLDAHGRDLPLSEEVNIITQNWSQFVIVIDDFEVPCDDGYHFNNYKGKVAFNLKCFGFDKIKDIVLFSPSALSSSETGFKRGCIVLISKDSLLARASELKSLRVYPIKAHYEP